VVDVSHFYGRQSQLTTLTEWIVQDRCRLVAIVGMGGIGKTAIAARLAHQLEPQFSYLVWRSLRQAPALPDLLTDLLQTFSPQQLPSLQLDGMMRLLLEQLRRHRCLLILDNAEAILCGNELVGTYRPGYETYGWLFQQLGEGQHQSSVLLTSREVPAEVATLEGPLTAVRLLRLGQLSTEAGEAILTAKGLTAAMGRSQWPQLIERYQGNPLALKIVATPIKELFGGNIAAFLAQEAGLFRGIRDLLTQQFNRLSWLEQQVMYWLAVNREAVTPAQLQMDLLPSVSAMDLQDALVSLDRRSLIEKVAPESSALPSPSTLVTMRYTQQPVVMEYITERLIEQVCMEVQQGRLAWLKAHALLKAQAKEYVRNAQTRLIVQPILTKLLEAVGGRENLKALLLQLLSLQRSQAPLEPSYFAGNAINLLVHLNANLSHQNFSDLVIWQADLRAVELHATNFRNADFSHSVFTQSFSDVLCAVISPDDQYVATSDYSGAISLWQIDNGQLRASLTGMTLWVKSLAFSPKNSLLVSSNQDQTVILWDIPSGAVMGTLLLQR
jgi:hypothetical protein